VLLDARTRRAGSHHQKLVVVRHPGLPARDVAFVGGIDLGYGRNDDSQHAGDPQVMTFPGRYGPRPPWHDIQAEVRGPAVHDLEHTFRERWYGSSALDLPSPIRQLYDRADHIGAMTSRPLPEPTADDRARRGTHAVQMLRTYPARLRRYPFAPHGERSIAHAYQKAFARARCLVYLEDQYLWSRPVAAVIAAALRDNPGLHVIAVVPRYPDNDGAITQMPGVLGRYDVVRACTAAGGERFAVYDLENHQGTPVYVHAKAVIVDDVWAMVGSDNLNRRSWSHDSELSIAVLDSQKDPREPCDPAGQGDGARTFARDLRLQLCREHLDRDEDDVDDLLQPQEAFAAFRRQAELLVAWHYGGRSGPRPPGRVLPHRRHRPTTAERLWGTPLYRMIYDPDGRPWRDKLRGRL
jgi:phosphatidylserine/phosphatidylglycerophosphate/cardiolipin synthase-like enzyme